MIYIIHGKDSFRCRISLKNLTQQHSTVERYSADDISPAFVGDFLRGSDLFGGEKTLVIENAFSHTTLIQNIQQHAPTISQHELHTLICYEDQDISKHSAYKHIQPVSEVILHNQSTRNQDIDFLREYFKKDVAVCNSVVEVYNKCQGNMEMAMSELQKLSVFCVDRVATQKDQDNLSIGVIQENIFITIDAIFSKNKIGALERIQNSWMNGDSPELMLTMLERQLKIIALVLGEMESGVQSYQTIASNTQQHPFVVKKTMPLTKRFRWNELQNLYQRIESLDTKVKQGYMSPYFACELFSFAVLSI